MAEQALISWWNRVVVPRAVHRVLATPAVTSARRDVLRDLHGTVVEIGFGSGLSLAAYPSTVTRVLAVDPDDTGWDLSEPVRRKATEGRTLGVQRAGRDAARLPMPDESADHVVSLWTLCTVPDLDGALAEIFRVLRPGGSFVFAEHGPSSRSRRRRAEGLLEPVWRPLAGGCHLTREPWLALPAFGFDPVEVRRPTDTTGLPPGTRLGRAVRPAS